MKKKLLLLIPLTLIFLFVMIFSLGNLEPQYERSGFNLTPLTEAEMLQIQKDTKDLKNEKEFFNYAIKRTNKKLHFTKKNNLKKGEANCIGYSALSKQYLEYALKINGRKNITYHYVGLVNSCGMNLNNILVALMPSQKMKAFVKDHDFLGMKLETGELLLASPSLKDIFGFSFFTLRSN